MAEVAEWLGGGGGRRLALVTVDSQAGAEEEGAWPATHVLRARLSPARQMSEVAWLRNTFGLRHLQIPFTVVIGPHGKVLEMREGAAASREEDLAMCERASKRMAQDLLVGLAVAQALAAFEQRTLLPDGSSFRLLSARKWLGRPAKRRGLRVTPPGAVGVLVGKKDDGTRVVGVQLLDGSRLVGRFDLRETRLRQLRQFIDAQRTDGDAEYALVCAFSRRRLEESDLHKTLKALQMDKNNLVELVPLDGSPAGAGPAAPAPASESSGPLALLTAPLAALWALVAAVVARALAMLGLGTENV